MAQIRLEDTVESPAGAPAPRAQRRRAARTVAAVPDEQPAAQPAGESMLSPEVVAQVAAQLQDKQTARLREPEGDEGSGVEFVRTGWVRLPGTDGDRWRLRAPMFGELRMLRLAFDSLIDELEGLQVTGVEVAVARQTAHEAAERLQEPDRSRALHEANRAERTAMQEVVAKQEDLRVGWWLQVLDLLCVEGEYPTSADEPLPGWTAAIELPAQCIQHWRSVPLGPGR